MVELFSLSLLSGIHFHPRPLSPPAAPGTSVASYIFISISQKPCILPGSFHPKEVVRVGIIRSRLGSVSNRRRQVTTSPEGRSIISIIFILHSFLSRCPRPSRRHHPDRQPPPHRPHLSSAGRAAASAIRTMPQGSLPDHL